ncbi:MAG: hypothetical protein HY791_16695 [Deltaproteobacteria bacterium]|nr:hypothetical protein [Deltaproteobacteria bacterium]
MSSAGSRGASLVFEALSHSAVFLFACSAVEEDVTLRIPPEALDGSETVILSVHGLRGIRHLAAASTASVAQILPEIDRTYSGEPLTLSVLTYAESLDSLRLQAGPLRIADSSSRYLGPLDWTRPGSPFVEPLRVLSISVAEGGKVEVPVEREFAELSPTVRDLAVEIGPGFCDPPNTSLIFEGDLPDVDDAPDYQAMVIRPDGLAIFGGLQNRRDPETGAQQAHAIIAHLDLPALGQRPERVDPSIEFELDAPFIVVRELVGEATLGFLGSAESSTTTLQYLFETDELGRPGTPWPSPFAATTPKTPFRMAPLDGQRVLLYTNTQVFEFDRQSRSAIERTDEFPPNLADYAGDALREYVMTVVETRREPSPPSFRGMRLFTRARGELTWRLELQLDEEISETDFLPVLSVDTGPSGPIATANTMAYLRQDSGEWIGDRLGAGTTGKMAGLSISAERRLVFGFAGFIGVHHPRYGWCVVPNSGSSRSANGGVADPLGHYAIAIDQGNPGRLIPTWLAILSFSE